MIAGTIITLISIPIYYALNRAVGAMGLAIASDIGILMQTATLAILLHRSRAVSLSGLDYLEFFRAAIASALGYGALVTLRHYVPATSRANEVALLFIASLVWGSVCALVLTLTGSTLLSQIVSRIAKSRVS